MERDLFGEIIEELLVDVPVDIRMELEEDIYEDDDYSDEEKYECSGYEDNGYEWTEEDSWDALTDGMYGDMPSSPWEYDAMMDAMGY